MMDVCVRKAGATWSPFPPSAPSPSSPPLRGLPHLGENQLMAGEEQKKWG